MASLPTTTTYFCGQRAVADLVVLRHEPDHEHVEGDGAALLEVDGVGADLAHPVAEPHARAVERPGFHRCGRLGVLITPPWFGRFGRRFTLAYCPSRSWSRSSW